MSDFIQRDILIQCGFQVGLTQREICELLESIGIYISERHIRRTLQKLNLRRRGNFTDCVTVVNFIYNQLQSSGKLHGYRWMHEKCLMNGLRVRREDVRVAMSLMDPDGCLFRRWRRLYRRSYSTPGPHFVWHVDGYDKIKPFGFGINGCIDGFSRKIIWLNVYTTNNDPKVIAGYFVEALRNYTGAPKILRTDEGTENVIIRDIQQAILDQNGEQLLFISGSSHSNQRIESFWGQLRKQCLEYWISFFHTLQDTGSFNGDSIDKSLLQFCFMAIIQDELDVTANTWNRHKVRKCRRGLPSGRPVVLMEAPFLYGTKSYLNNVKTQESEHFQRLCVFREAIPCDPDMFDLCSIIMHEDGFDYPNSNKSALDLYIHLRVKIRTILGIL